MSQPSLTTERRIAPERHLDVDASDVLFRLQSRWLTILVFVAAGVMLGVLYTARAKPVWEAKASVVFPAMSQAALGGVAATMGFALPGQSASPIKVNHSILESRRARDYVGPRVGLSDKQLRLVLTAKDDPPSGLLSLSVKYKDPTETLKITELFIEAMSDLNRRLSLPQARTQVLALQKQLEEKRAELRRAEEHLRNTQTLTKTAPGADPLTGATNRYAQQLNETEVELARVRASIAEARGKMESLAAPGTPPPAEMAPARQWRDRLANLEYDLRVEEMTYGVEAPSVVRLRGQIAVARKQLQQELERYLSTVRANAEPSLAGLEATRVGLEAQQKVLRDLAARAPEEAVDTQRQVREVTALGALVQQIRIQYESARLLAATDPNRWEVLDPPALSNDGRPVNKRWVVNAAMLGVLGFLLGSAIVLVRTRPRQQPSLPPGQIPATL
ncbi:MAG TPA: Wzz/FepE/Etk N-terminal domain-containing protein [Armatimonadota bacterium]